MSERRLLSDEELHDIRQRLEDPVRADRTLLAHASRAMLAHIEAMAGLLADMQIDSLAYREGVMVGRIERNAEVVDELRGIQKQHDFMDSTGEIRNDWNEGYLSGLNDAIATIED